MKDNSIEVGKDEAQPESRFRLIVVAAFRAKQLLHGAKPRIEVDVHRRKHISIAMEEVRRGLIRFEKLSSAPRPESFRAEFVPKPRISSSTSMFAMQDDASRLKGASRVKGVL